MEMHKKLKSMKNISPISPKEEAIQKTITASREVYESLEQNRLLTCWEFLWTQLRYTRKRWWAMQTAMLLAVSRILPGMENDFLRLRSIGVVGCLFVVFMIPELWRNRESEATQVEAACLYSLRQVYAARITLFGMVDVVLLSWFCISLGRLGLSWLEVMIQFLLPAAVTACICFALLCGRRGFSETASVAACLIWSGGWWLLLMNEAVYASIVPAVWISLFAMALAFLAWAVRRAVRTTNQYWEVTFA